MCKNRFMQRFTVDKTKTGSLILYNSSPINSPNAKKLICFKEVVVIDLKGFLIVGRLK